MRKLAYITAVFVMLALAITTLVGCVGAGAGSKEEKIVAGTGTIKYIDLEGGFYGIVSDDNQKYDPANLDRSFQQDGLKVKFQARVRKDIIATHMWGTPIEVLSIDKCG